MKRKTLYIAIAIGANTMYFQIGRRDTLLSAFHQFSARYQVFILQLALSK